MTLSFKHILCSLLCLGVTTIAVAGNDDLACSAIPADLLKNANAVIRYYHTEMQIVTAQKIYITEKFAVTILNEKGRDHAVLREIHDQFSDIEYMQGELYDKDGRQLQKLKQRKIMDVNPDMGEFISDSHYNIFDFQHAVYPYTCVYEVKMVYNQSVFISPWEAGNSRDMAVEHTDIAVEYPADCPLRYRTFHFIDKPAVTVADGVNKLTASFSNLPALGRSDDFSPRENYSTPTIVFAADKFLMQDMQGEMATWKGYGQFFYDLNKNRDTLPASMKKIVHQLTDTCKTNKEKISILYSYLEANYRYVAIILGIGGWQTLDANFVAEKGYGDCKALSNYMKSLLKEAGVTAYQSLVYGDRDDPREMMLDFPYSTFNHVILCVPGQADTTWLECTSTTLPAGYLSSFTGNRYVLMLTPSGGVPVKTPGCTAGDNMVVRTADIKVNANNEQEGTADLKYSGEMWERESGMVIGAPKSEVDNYFNNKFSVGSYSVSNYQVHNQPLAAIPFLNEQVAIKGSGNITTSGKNLFISPAIFPKSINAPSSYEKRKKDFSIHKSYTITDTVTYHFIGQYASDASSGEVSLHFPFADYHYNAVLEGGNTLKVFVSYTLRQGTYPADSFTDYIKLYKELNVNLSADKIILTKVD